MYTFSHEPIASLALSSAAGSVGSRIRSVMPSGTQTHRVLLTITASITVAAAPITAWRNRASAWALLSAVGIQENGADKVNLEGRDLRALSEVFAPSALSATRPTAVIAATYAFKESAVINLAHPFSMNQRETAFREKNIKAPLEVFAILADDWKARICDIGGATVTLDSCVITAEVVHDPYEQKLPYLIPQISQYRENVAGVNPALVSYVRSPNYLRGMLIAQDTNVGEVSDIIVGMNLRDDYHFILGPQQVAWNDFVRRREYDFGGLVYPSVAAAEGYGYIDLQKYGRLSNALNPKQMSNLRFEFSVAPSAAAGATSSIIRVTLLELVKDMTVLPDGRTLVDPNIPFDI